MNTKRLTGYGIFLKKQPMQIMLGLKHGLLTGGWNTNIPSRNYNP